MELAGRPRFRQSGELRGNGGKALIIAICGHGVRQSEGASGLRERCSAVRCIAFPAGDKGMLPAT